ncbi:MAG: hypothetical protein ABSG65_05510 [Bryobacteraceae bacterium]
MSKLQRVREVPSGPLSQDYVSQKAKEGWKLTAVEWEREVDEPAAQPGPLTEEVPYGLRVSADCSHLEENVTEKQALVLMMDLIVQDAPLSLVAEELNRKGRIGVRYAAAPHPSWAAHLFQHGLVCAHPPSVPHGLSHLLPQAAANDLQRLIDNSIR